MSAMALPALIYVVAVSVWPISQAIWFSFFDYNLLRPHRTEFIGLENYVRLFVEPTGLRAIINTFAIKVMAVLDAKLFNGFYLKKLIEGHSRNSLKV